jgi:hypothetical protein
VSQSPPYTGNELVVSTGPLKHLRAILQGAKNPPVATECTSTLRLDQDGNAGPLICGRNHVNVEAWDYFERNDFFPIMSLPRNAPECEIASFIKEHFVSTPINDSAFQLANAYNGWRFPEGLAAHILVSTPFDDPC